MPIARRILFACAVPALLLAACGDDTDDGAGADGRPTVVVTTSILGDVVEHLAGGHVDVITIMPTGADPHDFQASAQQANRMRQADALIVNGAGFEEGLLAVIDGAVDDGVPTHEAISAVDTIEFGGGGHDDEHGHAEEEHAEGEHGEDDHGHADEHDEDDHGHADEHDEDHGGHGHDEGSVDPHFFQDPARMADAARGIVDFLVATVDGIDADALERDAAEYIDELLAVDAQVEATLAEIPEERRVLITNHDAIGYLADRYDFEVAGTVIPSGSTTDGASARHLNELADLVRRENVTAIFSENTAGGDLARTLADEVGAQVEVVQLFTDSLGGSGTDAATYLGMVRSNAELIVAALG